MSNIIKKIAARAKAIRKAHPSMKWQSCIKQASRELKGSAKAGRTVKKKGAAKKKARVGAASKNRQTGSSNRKRDRQRTAKAPGKRIVRHTGKKSTVYYERRKNRSDAPGKLSGVTAYQHMILSRIGNNTRNIEAMEKEVERMRQLTKLAADKKMKLTYSTAIKDRKKYIASLKADNRMLKRILK